ncbi:hypothetical protein [Streptomyces sp. Y7]|uniref:hypothetical protein n=1 Tax=Streptomyces sp. Y7 TaxID=3342392 RepID=UPI00371F5DE3
MTASDVVEGGDAEVHSGAAAVLFGIQLGELVLGSGEADFKSFQLAQPAFTFGFGDAGVRLSRISARRPRRPCSGRSIEQRTQACSWMHEVPKSNGFPDFVPAGQAGPALPARSLPEER